MCGEKIRMVHGPITDQRVVSPGQVARAGGEEKTEMGGDSDAVEPDQQNESVMYGIRLLIRHPSIDPADITSKLGLKPGMSSTAGAERKTPAGTRLPGVYKTSTWGYWLDVEGNRYFSKDILSLLLHLEERAEFIRELID